MESSMSSLSEILHDEKLLNLDKMIVVCTLLCAFTIILSIALTQLFAVLLIALSIIRFIQHPQWNKTPFDLPLLAFLLSRIVSVLLSSNPSLSMRTLYAEVPYYAIFFAVSQQRMLIQKRYLISILWLFFSAATLASCYGTITVLLGLKERATSIISGYYTLGSFLTATLSILLVVGRTKLFEKKRWLWFCFIIITAGGILLTLNRIHWGITVLVFLIVGIIQERKLLFGVTICFVLAVCLSPIVSQRLVQTIHFTANLSDRDLLWKGALMIWFNHPVLGYGPGTFVEVFPLASQLKDAGVGGWHNDYLKVFIESGAVGLITLLWLIATVYRRVFRYLCMQQVDVFNKRLVVAITFGISTIFLSSLTGSAFLDILILMMSTFLLAILTVLLQNNSNGEEKSVGEVTRS